MADPQVQQSPRPSETSPRPPSYRQLSQRRFNTLSPSASTDDVEGGRSRSPAASPKLGLTKSQVSATGSGSFFTFSSSSSSTAATTPTRDVTPLRLGGLGFGGLGKSKESLHDDGDRSSVRRFKLSTTKAPSLPSPSLESTAAIERAQKGQTPGSRTEYRKDSTAPAVPPRRNREASSQAEERKRTLSKPSSPVDEASPRVFPASISRPESPKINPATERRRAISSAEAGPGSTSVSGEPVPPALPQPSAVPPPPTTSPQPPQVTDAASPLARKGSARSAVPAGASGSVRPISVASMNAGPPVIAPPQLPLPPTPDSNATPTLPSSTAFPNAKAPPIPEGIPSASNLDLQDLDVTKYVNEIPDDPVLMKALLADLLTRAKQGGLSTEVAAGQLPSPSTSLPGLLSPSSQNASLDPSSNGTAGEEPQEAPSDKRLPSLPQVKKTGPVPARSSPFVLAQPRAMPSLLGSRAGDRSSIVSLPDNLSVSGSGEHDNVDTVSTVSSRRSSVSSLAATNLKGAFERARIMLRSGSQSKTDSPQARKSKLDDESRSPRSNISLEPLDESSEPAPADVATLSPRSRSAEVAGDRTAGSAGDNGAASSPLVAALKRTSVHKPYVMASSLSAEALHGESALVEDRSAVAKPRSSTSVDSPYLSGDTDPDRSEHSATPASSVISHTQETAQLVDARLKRLASRKAAALAAASAAGLGEGSAESTSSLEPTPPMEESKASVFSDAFDHSVDSLLKARAARRAAAVREAGISNEQQPEVDIIARATIIRRQGPVANGPASSHDKGGPGGSTAAANTPNSSEAVDIPSALPSSPNAAHCISAAPMQEPPTPVPRKRFSMSATPASELLAALTPSAGAPGFQSSEVAAFGEVPSRLSRLSAPRALEQAAMPDANTPEGSSRSPARPSTGVSSVESSRSSASHSTLTLSQIFFRIPDAERARRPSFDVANGLVDGGVNEVLNRSHVDIDLSEDQAFAEEHGRRRAHTAPATRAASPDRTSERPERRRRGSLSGVEAEEERRELTPRGRRAGSDLGLPSQAEHHADAPTTRAGPGAGWGLGAALKNLSHLPSRGLWTWNGDADEPADDGNQRLAGSATPDVLQNVNANGRVSKTSRSAASEPKAPAAERQGSLQKWLDDQARLRRASVELPEASEINASQLSLLPIPGGFAASAISTATRRVQADDVDDDAQEVFRHSPSPNIDESRSQRRREPDAESRESRAARSSRKSSYREDDALSSDLRNDEPSREMRARPRTYSGRSSRATSNADGNDYTSSAQYTEDEDDDVTTDVSRVDSTRQSSTSRQKATRQRMSDYDDAEELRGGSPSSGTDRTRKPGSTSRSQISFHTAGSETGRSPNLSPPRRPQRSFTDTAASAQRTASPTAYSEGVADLAGPASPPSVKSTTRSLLRRKGKDKARSLEEAKVPGLDGMPPSSSMPFLQAPGPRSGSDAGDSNSPPQSALAKSAAGSVSNSRQGRRTSKVFGSLFRKKQASQDTQVAPLLEDEEYVDYGRRDRTHSPNAGASPGSAAAHALGFSDSIGESPRSLAPPFDTSPAASPASARPPSLRSTSQKAPALKAQSQFDRREEDSEDAPARPRKVYGVRFANATRGLGLRHVAEEEAELAGGQSHALKWVGVGLGGRYGNLVLESGEGEEFYAEQVQAIKSRWRQFGSERRDWSTVKVD